ncbi:MAG: hypothetical protein SFX73_34795 [Kofleriaceae bacterium]|nr:hypothetical protein [Kofleriaceae bacterium]
MPQVRSLLKDVTIEVAERKRKCHRDKRHAIAKGETCLVVIDELGGKKNYCETCAEPILSKVEADLRALRSALQNGATSAA